MITYTLHGSRQEMTVVARGEFGVQGYCRVRPRKYAYSLTADEGRYVEILELFVGEESRRQGLGTALVQEILDWARAMGFTHVNVNVSSGNEEFWETLGYVPQSVMYHLTL